MSNRKWITSGAAFRASCYSALIFLIIFSVASVVSVWKIEEVFRHEIESQILIETRFIEETLDDNDSDVDVLEAIRETTSISANRTNIVGLFYEDSGQKLAGNIDEIPPFKGWGDWRQTSHVSSQIYRLNVKRYKGYIIVAGQSRLFMNSALRLTKILLVAVGIFGAGLTMAIGYGFSVQTYRKLRAIEGGLDKIAAGDLSARLPVKQQNDQIDRVAKMMNIHIDSLSALITNTKSTASSIAHDLKTPLSRASAKLQTAIINHENDGRSVSELQGVQQELDRLGWIFATILRISRIENSVESTKMQTFDFADITADIFETFSPLAEDSSQVLKHSISASCGTSLYGDAAMLEQMLVNLIQNGIKYCPKNAEIAMELSGDDDNLIVSVSDTGPGVPPEHHESIFNMFTQVQPERSSGGSGLGLALVKAVADRHGGTITVSDNNPGLRIDVQLPRRIDVFHPRDEPREPRLHRPWVRRLLYDMAAPFRTVLRRRS